MFALKFYMFFSYIIFRWFCITTLFYKVISSLSLTLIFYMYVLYKNILSSLYFYLPSHYYYVWLNIITKVSNSKPFKCNQCNGVEKLDFSVLFILNRALISILLNLYILMYNCII